MTVKKNNYNKGFSLVEIMTSLSIFIVVVTISMGAILGVYNASRKARAESSLMGNLNLAIETMTREIRFGKNYHCGDTGNLAFAQNCSIFPGMSFISFISSDGVPIYYKLNGTSIEKSINGSEPLPVTSPEVVINSLSFYVFGAGVETPPDPQQQPRVTISIKGTSGVKSSDTSQFIIQTIVSQRKLDNGL